ncbi:LOW QUALITY PROTEIN: hypothetical protein Cgig2_016234 [Carnegiea gigantea]|uniref:Uncharacterized protein n=1 Tax=Carnegiea gigantea TaxID=171969 RepID=A0A9Q1JHX1_9CARY|nr:LOW QUALITY PROTEIN: hypothetical protein Cgig2_016234 [Carnegiea gigantea]
MDMEKGRLQWVPTFFVADSEGSTVSNVAGDLPSRSRVPVVFLAGDQSPATFPVTGESPEFHFLRFSFQKRPSEVFQGQRAVTHGMRGCKRFVAIESKSFDLAIGGTAKDVWRISENGRERTSLLLPENIALWLLRAWGRFYKSKSSNWCNQVRRGSSIFPLESKRKRAGKFLQLSVLNKGKRTFVIFPPGWNERGWAKIFDALPEIANLAFLGSTEEAFTPSDTGTWYCASTSTSAKSTTSRLLSKVWFTGKPECFLRSVPHVAAITPARNVNEAAEELSLSKHMQVDRGKQRVVTELGIRASRSVTTQVYSQRNSFGNRRNRVRETNRSSSEGSVCADWPPDALLVRDASSPSTDEAKWVDPALFEAKICVQASSNAFVPLARDVVVSHQVHMGSLVMDIHPISDS